MIVHLSGGCNGGSQCQSGDWSWSFVGPMTSFGSGQLQLKSFVT